MGIITGYLCLLCMLFLMLKYAARKFRWDRVSSFLMKYHKYAAALFLLISAAHFLFVLPVLASRLPVIAVSGIVVAAAGLAIVIFCHTMKDRKKELLLHRLLSLLIVGMVLVHMIFYQVGFSRYQTQIREIAVNEVDPSGVPDGEYIGESDVGYIYAKVRLTVKDGKITKAELLEHRNERGSRAETIPERIVSEQRIQVDAVSGATNSSRVIEKACENALRRN